MQALLSRARRRSPESAGNNLNEAVVRCSSLLPTPKGGTRSSCQWDKEEWKGKLRERQSLKQWRFEPPSTSVGDPDRHPWEGETGDLTVGEFAVGAGCFMATAVASGWTAQWMAEPKEGSRALARANCKGCPTVFESVFDVDPARLPWVHLLLGGACCQPFSKAGLGHGWGDDRAYSTIRFLHNVAVMQPYVAISENVQAVLAIHGGRVWTAVKGTLEATGFEVQAVRV